MDELTNAIITINLLPSNYDLQPDEEKAIDKVVRAAVNYNELSRAQPDNPPLTLEQLRQMDGEPVYIVEAPDWGHWELSVDAEDYLCDRDTDFYGMMHDDPAGRYGLHALGWLAYARKLEVAQR